MSIPKVLAFTPYAAWRLHTNYETTISRACQMRGAEVKHVLCNALFGECDMYGAAMSSAGRPFNLCTQCQAQSKAALDEAGLPYEWLGQYIMPKEKREIFQWAQRLQPEEFEDAQFRGFPIGASVITSVVSYFRSYPIDLNDWQTVNVYRGFLHGGAMAMAGLSRLLDQWQPDALLLFNGRMSVLRVAFTLARQRGIRVLIHERPQSGDTVMIVENQIVTSPIPFQRFWRQWGEVPLTRLQLQQALQWFRDRRGGSPRAGNILFATSPQGAAQLRQQLGLAPGHKLAVMFTTSTDEFAGDPDSVGPFGSQETWIERVAEWAGQRPEMDLVIRTHPSLSGKAGTGSAASQVEWFQRLQERLPPNVRIVLPSDPLSSYDLMDIADFAITYGSTAGLEMFSLGKPLVTTPPIPMYLDVSGVQVVRDVGDLETVLDRASALPPSREYQRFAFRCIYRYFFHKQVLFPLVTMPGPWESRLNYDSADALKPGRDAGLDRLCDFLLHGTPVFPGPTLEESRVSLDEEEAFFDQLAAQPNWQQPTKADQTQVQKAKRRKAAIQTALRLGARLPSPVRRLLKKAVPKDLVRRFR